MADGVASRTAERTRGPATVSPGLVLLLCSGATFMAFLDLSVVSIAFPEIMSDFAETDMSALTWVISGYAVTFAAFLTPAGRLADTVGRAQVFGWSLAGFTVASLVCAAAPDAGWLIGGRLAQGAMAAGMIPASLGLILANTPFERLMKAIGAWSAAAGFSAVIGPVVGGLLVEQFSWRSVFLINGPIGLLLILGGLRALPRPKPPAGRLPDLAGTLALALGIGLVVAALTEGDRWGWTSTTTLTLLAGGSVLGVAALLRSRTHPAPAIDTQLWQSRRFAVCNLVSVIFGASMYAWLLAGPLFATRIWHWSIMEAAGALTIGAVASMVTATLAGRVTDPTRHRWVVALGAGLFAVCTALMASDLFGTEPRFWSAWVPAGLLGGAGLGFAVTALSSAAATALPPLRFAAGVGMNLTARQLGGALGTAGLAAIMAVSDQVDVDAFHTLYLACTVVTVVAGLVVLAMPNPAPVPAPAAS